MDGYTSFVLMMRISNPSMKPASEITDDWHSDADWTASTPYQDDPDNLTTYPLVVFLNLPVVWLCLSLPVPLYRQPGRLPRFLS